MKYFLATFAGGTVKTIEAISSEIAFSEVTSNVYGARPILTNFVEVDCFEAIRATVKASDCYE